MKLEIELKICGLADFLSLGTETLRRIDSLEQQQEKLMARSQEAIDLIAKFNTATNAVKARLDALEAKVAAGGMSAAEEKEFHDEMHAIGSTLEAMGADPNQPVPPPVTA